MDSSSLNIYSEEYTFGQRYLQDENAVFVHNAWDNVDWSEEEEARAKALIEAQKCAAANNDDSKSPSLLVMTHEKWNAFYATHENRFFMDRKWVSRELPEIFNRLSEGKDVTILDVGCGVGNATFPLLNVFSNDKVFIYSCDFSATAIHTLRQSDHYNTERCSAFVWDLTSDKLPTDESHPDTKLSNMDFILCIYVLSAIPPEQHARAIENLALLLAPGGIIFIKDYARYDLTQLRFKAHRLLCDNLYVRGDGTLVYFFDSDEMDSMLKSSNLTKLQNHIDKRLIVNRAKQIKMYRRWIQCKYTK